MKVKNIVFSGVMGAILMGATGANAAINVASQGYVDSKVGAVSTAVTELETTVSNTYQTKADATTAAQETSAALDLKANAADVYTKEYVNTELAKLELKTDAIDKLKEAKDYTEDQIEALKNALGTGGEGEEGATGLTAQVLTNTADIVSLKDKVGDKTVAQSISDALKDYSTTAQVDAKDAATLQSAKAYADGLAGNYDAAGSAATAKSEAIEYTDTKLNDYTKTSELDADFVTEAEMTTFKSENTSAIADAKKAGTDAAAAAANAQTQADKGVADAAAAKSAADAAQAQADKGVADAATAKSAADAAQAQADKGVEDAAAAKSAADAAQADADANTESISQLQTDLATKITAPAACEKQDCVLSINKASGTISWVPLTEPVADYL